MSVQGRTSSRNNPRLIHNQRESTERDVNLPASNAVNDFCNLGFDFAFIVETDEDCRADLNLFGH
jgi:hypothetical protein